MEEIIEEIWNDIEKFGWDSIKENKQYYLDIIRQKGFNNSLHWLEVDGEVVVNEIYCKQAEIVYECGECGQKFDNRGDLYDHYSRDHKTHIPL